jgi:hypothetical protein
MPLVSDSEKIILEAKDKIRPEPQEQFAQQDQFAPQTLCVECLETVTEPVITGRRGETLCAGCTKNYYVACSTCGGLIPQDEALSRDDAVYCSDCEAQALKATAGDAPDESAVESLVTEFIKLHAEEKRIKDRLDEIKEQLKAAALARQRVAGAVTLGGAEGAVKCSFKTNLKCIPEKVSALEGQLEAERFAALFERKVSYSPVKDNLEKFLSGDEGADANLRALVLSAIEKTETPTLTVVRPKK